jgi:hypothetical protein
MVDTDIVNALVVVVSLTRTFRDNQPVFGWFHMEAHNLQAKVRVDLDQCLELNVLHPGRTPPAPKITTHQMLYNLANHIGVIAAVARGILQREAMVSSGLMKGLGMTS